MVELLSQYGIYGIFLLAILEAIFLPVPVESLLIPFMLINPKMILIAIIVSTLGSVIGAAIGNRIGFAGEKVFLGRIIDKKKIESSQKYFKKFGVWAIGVAALTPLPYKIFAIISGLIGIGVYKVITVSLIARGARFTAVCLWVTTFGQVIT